MHNTQPKPKGSHRPRSGLVRRLCSLDPVTLSQEAKRRTALNDFGSPTLEPALATLAQSLEQEAALHPLGRLLIRLHLRDLLATRLRLVDLWKRRPDALAAQRVDRPIFIVGVPRSGSTFLHELLVRDTAHRAPEVWEVMEPLAATGGDSRVIRRAIRRVEFCLWWFRRLAPRADATYPMRARTPHECIAIHSYSLLSQEFVVCCHVPAYAAFLRAADLRPAYEWERQFLQHLQVGGPDRRWVLKAPDHVYGLEQLFAVFPDAMLIQTHRNPLEVLGSLTDLFQVLRGLYGRPADWEVLLAAQMRILADNAERFLQFRERHPELKNRIVDVKYTELAADPLATVRRIYEQLGLALTESASDRMRQLAASRSRYRGPRASAGAHRLNFGNGCEVGSFERYCEAFGLPFQPRAGFTS